MKRATVSLSMFAAGASGFIALSYEIIWFRVFGFITAGAAPTFGVVLAVFLAGVAFGSLAVTRLCSSESAAGDRAGLVIPATLLAAASVLGFAVIPAVAHVCATGKWTTALPLVAVVAGILGGILPLVAHFGVAADERAGQHVSYLYVANIVGSTAGSLVTGFVLLDLWPLATVALALTLAGAGVAASLFVASGRGAAMLAGVTMCIAVAGLSFAAADAAFADTWKKLQLKNGAARAPGFTHVVENRHGVITVDTDNKVYGGGIYDGAFNVNPVHDVNLVIRPYALAGFHAKPRRVLMMGLASGSWAQVIAHHPDVHELVVVEINPGYLALVQGNRKVRSLLTNKRVRIVIDDFRRWLHANPGERFDAVVMNNSFHWRGASTNLMSTELFGLLKGHLEPGGLVFYNTTNSLNAMKTGCVSFAHGARVINFMMVSDAPLVRDKARCKRVLQAYTIDGKRVFDPTNKWHRARIDEMIELRDEALGVTDGRWFERCASILAYTKHQAVITDDNMVTEWYRPWDAIP